jgi:hypothetical protein
MAARRRWRRSRPEPLNYLEFDGEIALELLSYGLADADREYALVIRQAVEEHNPVGEELGVPHLFQRLGASSNDSARVCAESSVKPQLSCILECRKYCLIAVSSLVSCSLSNSRTSPSPRI